MHTITQRVEFNADLIRRYDISGSHYASYPTVNRFNRSITPDDYRMWARRSNEDPIPRPLSLYVHIPFCEVACFYCACSNVVTKDHSKAGTYLDHLYRELAMQAALFDKDRIVEQLYWGGGTPTFLAEDEIRSLMAATHRHFSLHTDDKGEYGIEIDPRSVDHSKLNVLREVGFNRVSLGVQDLNPRVQTAVNLAQGLEVTQGVTESVRELGFKSVNMDLMYGLPYQTEQSFEETLQAVTEMSPDRLAIYNYAHLPPRFKPQRSLGADGLPSADESLGILQHTIDQLTGAGYVYIGMGHFARPEDELARAQSMGRLQRNFQGYSTHADCDLIGLGVSAISKVCDNYSQNALELDEYYERIDAGKYPLERGIELEADDLLRHEIINQLICHFVLHIKAFEEKWQFSFSKHFSSEIQDLLKMQNDGLLTLGEESLEVLPEGRLLVRNICRVFDRYLQNNNADFSKAI